MIEHPIYDQLVFTQEFDPASVERTPWDFAKALEQADQALWRKDQGQRKKRRRSR